MTLPDRAELVSYFASHGWAWFDGPWNVNLIGLRADDRRSDSFDDWIGCFVLDEDGKPLDRWFPATTDPSVFYLKGGSAKFPAHPQGTAMLVHGRQYRGCWELGLHHNSYPALVQRRPMTFVRDANRDGVRDYEELVAAGKTFDGVIGCNLHRASNTRDVETIGAYGAACQVLQHAPDLDEVLKVVRKQQAAKLGKSVSYALGSLRDFA